MSVSEQVLNHGYIEATQVMPRQAGGDLSGDLTRCINALIRRGAFHPKCTAVVTIEGTVPKITVSYPDEIRQKVAKKMKKIEDKQNGK
jgi:hypothetical protein